MTPARRSSKPRQCVDCEPGAKRPAPNPGPRCATHHRERRKATRLSRQEAHVLRTYNLTPEQYEALYEAQGRCCYGCRRATGQRKRLAVDHDHSCCSGSTSCGKCVRGLLCSTCNKILGHYRDEADALFRMAEYLINPPAKLILGR